MKAWLRSAALIAGIALAYATLPPVYGDDMPPPERVTIQGPGTWISTAVSPGATVGSLLDQFKVAPPKGDIVALRSRRVMQRGVVSGSITLDGAPAGESSVVHNGSVVTLVRGPDVREPVERKPGPAVLTPNPARSLSPSFGATVMQVRGSLSGEVVTESAIPGIPIRPAVAITFDDGPNPAWTPRVLAILAQYKVPATFFVLGTASRRYPSLVRAEHAAGHSVQNHTWNHENLSRFASSAQFFFMRDQIRVLRSLGMPLEKWFRPPYGAMTRDTVRIASSLGMRTAIWSVDPYDWKRPPASVIASRVLSRVRPGSIVLMHDSGGDRSHTVAALPVILRTLIARGYRFVTLN